MQASNYNIQHGLSTVSRVTEIVEDPGNEAGESAGDGRRALARS